jgi:hypothetical protein
MPQGVLGKLTRFADCQRLFIIWQERLQIVRPYLTFAFLKLTCISVKLRKALIKRPKPE